MNMDDAIHNDRISTSKSFAWAWILWLALAICLHVLGSGPARLLLRRKLIAQGSLAHHLMSTFYSPLDWADRKPVFTQKPLRDYLHLWVPDLYDNKGNYTLPPESKRPGGMKLETTRYP